MYFVKKNQAPRGYSYSQLATFFQRMAKYRNPKIELITKGQPIIISTEHLEKDNYNLLKQIEFLHDVAPEKILLISSNDLLLEDNLNSTKVRTYQDGQFTSEMQAIISSVATISHPIIHWFVDIDQTLLLRHDSQLMQQVKVNNNLISLIKSSATYDKNIRVSVLTARKNPFLKFESSTTRLSKILSQEMLEQLPLYHALRVTDSFNTYDMFAKLEEILHLIDEMLDEEILEDFNAISVKLIRDELATYRNGLSHTSSFLVEDVQKIFQQESGMNLLIEQFSYVDTTTTTKANVIQTIIQSTVHQAVGDETNNVVIFADDNEKEINAAKKLNLATAKTQFFVLPIRCDGDLEINHEEKVKCFAQRLITANSDISMKKHDIVLSNANTFWKRHRPDIIEKRAISSTSNAPTTIPEYLPNQLTN